MAALLALVLALAGGTLANGSEPDHTYETTIAVDSPTAQYRFDDGSESTTLADSAGSNTATNHSIALGYAGPFGGSASGLLGGEGYATLSSDPLEGASEFTAETWIDWSGGSSYDEPIFDFGSSSTNHVYLTPASSASGHDLLLELHTSEGASARVTAPQLGEGAWIYVAVSESSAGTLKLYVDGTEVGHSEEAEVSPASLGSAPTAYVGKSLASAPGFDGHLSNIAFYDKALSASRIEAHYKSGEFPVDTEGPTISGTAEDGSTLTVGTGSWTGVAPITFGYQWRRCNGAGESCSDVSGATSSTYNPSYEDAGHKLRVLLTATNAAGSGEALASASAFVAPSPLAELGYASEFGSEGSGDGQFKEPWAIDVAASGDIFVLDRGNDRVEKFNEARQYLGEFGEEGSAEGQLSSPDALALDSKGDIFVLDTGNQRVEEFDEHGKFLRTIGAGLIGSAEGIAVDRHDRLWVSATYEGHLAVFGEGGEHIKDVGSPGTAPGELGEPEHLAVDGAGHVWVSDFTGRVEEFDEEAGEYIGQFGSYGDGVGQIAGAYGIAVDGGHVFVGERGDSRLQEFDEEGRFIAQLGVSGGEAGDLSSPAGLAVDPAHELLIADPSNNRVEYWSAEAPGIPANLAPPSVSGPPGVGSTLDVSAGAWSGSPRRSFSYQWQRCDEHGEECTDIEDATSTTYSPVSADLGSTLRVVVMATNAYGSASSTTAASEPISLPPVNTSPPTISGTAGEGEALTATSGAWENASGTAIQWERCDEHGDECANIEQTWGESYTPTGADVGHTLRVIAYASNKAGETTATSEPTAVIAPATPPTNLSAPELAGTARDGAILAARPGSWSGSPAPTYSYQWQICEADGSRCDDIDGATSASYTVQSVEVEGSLQVVVTASNVGGSASSTSAPSEEVEPGAPSELQPPAIEGSPKVSQSLEADSGEWGGAEIQLSYQWQLCEGDGSACSDIVGATGADYALTSAELGHGLRVEVGASNDLGSVVAISAATTAVESESALFNTWAPVISGTPQSGQTLTASAGSWLGPEALGYTYQWQHCDETGEACSDIEGATAAAYEATPTDVGYVLRVLATASEEHGATATASATSAPIAEAEGPASASAPRVTGSPLLGETLATSDGEWSGGTGSLTFAYQWQRCDQHGAECTPIAEATSREYTPSGGDAGSTLRARITATDAATHSSSATSASLLISASALQDVAAPSLSGPQQVGRGLTATPGIWTGASAIDFSYQWQRCTEEGEGCVDIDEATEVEYVPSEADAGHMLRVHVHANNGSESEDATSALTAAITTDSFSPENETPPSVEGDTSVGDVLTTQVGKWLSSEAIGYAYQWQRCDEEGESCADIEGANEVTHTLGEGDAGSTLRVLVTASNALGSAEATSDVTETIATPGPPADAEAPMVLGTATEGSRLAVDNGEWTGSRPLRYDYQWQRCNAEGEACTDIEGVTGTSYTVASGDLGSRLRVQVTAVNGLGTASVVSAPTEAVLTPAGAGGAHAVELAEEADPSALAKAEPASVEEQTVAPAVTDPGEELHATSGLTTADISKDTPGELALDTAGGEISLMPLDTAPGASAMPTVANETAAVFAETFPDTDTVVRPNALGATTLLQLRSAQAPTSISWEVGLGTEQELEELPDGSVAVVDAPTESLEAPIPSEVEPAPELEPVETEEEGYAETGAEEELEDTIAEEGPLENLAAAPQVTTPPFTPQSTEPHPQDTAAQAERDTGALAYAEAHTAGTVLMVIETPTVLDAEGNAVPARLSAEGGTVTLDITPEGAPAYPLIATESVATSSNHATSTKPHPVRYGLSDPKAPVFDSLDPKLESGPGKLHVGLARYVAAFNTGYHPQRLNALIEWLQAVGHAGLKPYITLGTLRSSTRPFCDAGEPCPAPTPESYKRDLLALVKKLNEAQMAETKHNAEVHSKKEGVEEQVIPSVHLWGAWNEPDLNLNKAENRDPLYNKPKIAARYWEIAQSVIRCRACRVVAGEFAEDSEKDHVKYIESYLTHILHDHYHHAAKPRNIGLHDYRDLVHVPESLSGYTNPAARTFVKLIKKRFGGHAHILFSEQGVEVEGSGGPTRLAKEKKNAKHRQLLAAEDFSKLGNVSRNVDILDYYLYRGPTKPEFDSGLLDGKKAPPADLRPAYCYLVLDHHGCPAKAVTSGAVADQTSTSSTAVLGTIEPNGLPTSYQVEWGTSSAYGHVTSVTETSQPEGAQSETIGLSGLECGTTYHYRVTAENEANEGTASYGDDRSVSLPSCEEEKEEEHTPFDGKTVDESRYYHHWWWNVYLNEYWSSTQHIVLDEMENTNADNELKEAEETEGGGVWQPLRRVTTPTIPSWVTAVTPTGFEGPAGYSLVRIYWSTLWHAWAAELSGPFMSGYANTPYTATYKVKWHAE